MIRKYILKANVLFWLLLLSAGSANALYLDLTPGGDGWINGGYFSTEDINPAGTGVIEPIVRLQATGNPDDQFFQEGTNTNQTTVLDEKPHWISVVELTSDYIFDYEGKEYVNFILDIDEPASKEYLELTKLILYADSSDQKYPYPTQTDTLLTAPWIWDMDYGSFSSPGGNGDSSVGTDYNLVSGGSGWWGDLSVLVPVDSTTIGQYLYLYSAFDYGNNNPEEWSMVASSIPEPAMMLLFGTGLAGLAGVGLRRRKK